MAKYKPAIFQATVRPSWAGIISYISSEEKAAILEAIVKFPVKTEIKSAFWEETIKPDLESQYEEFTNVCSAKGRASKNYWESTKNDKQIATIDTEKAVTTDIDDNILDTQTEKVNTNEDFELIRSRLVNNNVEEEVINIIMKQLYNPEESLKAYPADCYTSQNKKLLKECYKNYFNIQYDSLYDFLKKYKDKSIGEYYYLAVSTCNLHTQDLVSKQIFKFMGYIPNLEWQNWTVIPD